MMKRRQANKGCDEGLGVDRRSKKSKRLKSFCRFGLAVVLENVRQKKRKGCERCLRFIKTRF